MVDWENSTPLDAHNAITLVLQFPHTNHTTYVFRTTSRDPPGFPPQNNDTPWAHKMIVWSPVSSRQVVSHEVLPLRREVQKMGSFARGYFQERRLSRKNKPVWPNVLSQVWLRHIHTHIFQRFRNVAFTTNFRLGWSHWSTSHKDLRKSWPTEKQSNHSVDHALIQRSQFFPSAEHSLSEPVAYWDSHILVQVHQAKSYRGFKNVINALRRSDRFFLLSRNTDTAFLTHSQSKQ